MNKLRCTFLLLFFSVLTQGQWTQLNDIPFIDHHSNGFGYNGKGYIIQGSPTFNAGQSQNKLWEYDPQTDNWTELGFVPGPDREVAIGEEMNGKYYFGFGGNRNDLWEYDPASNTFTELPSCPCPGRAHPAFVAHNEKIYMGAGSGNNGDLNDWWVYDFATQTWSQKDDIPGTVRHHPYQFGIDNGIYVGGGHRTNWLKFDINTEEWIEIDNFPAGRVAGSQFDFDGKGFVLTGDAYDHSPLYDNQFLMYDPEVDEWYNLPFELSMHRWAPSSFIIDSTLYFFGGLGYPGGVSNGDDENDNVWKFDLTSINCLAPLNILAVDVQENSAGLFWTNSPTGDADTLQWREVGTTDWNNIINPQPSLVLEGLEGCKDYEFRINSKCGVTSVFSETKSFKTKGCGNCLDFTYCDVTEEFYALNCFINKVSINSYENVSGDNDGYEHFTSSGNEEVELGSSFALEVEPGFPFMADNTNYKIWLDFNADGNFDDNELVHNSSNINGNLVENIQIPNDATPGLTRMRIAMDINTLMDACTGNFFSDGEVEDYCITLIDNNSTNTQNLGVNDNSFDIYPNPFVNEINISSHNIEYVKSVEIHDITGVLIFTKNIEGLNAQASINIKTSNFEKGIYLLKIINIDNQIIHSSKLVK